MTEPGHKRIRVVQILECGGPGGTGNQVAALCNGLDPERFEVILVYAVRPGSTPQEYAALAQGASRFYYVPEMTREISPFLDGRAWWRVFKLLRELRPDVVHAHSSKAGFLARTAAWAAGVPRIFYSPRGYSFLQTDRSPLSRRFYKTLERSASWIGQVVAVSESEAALAREEARARKVRIVRDAYLGKILNNGSKPEEANIERQTTVCACGRMCYPRNPEAFVKLAQRLTDSRNGVRCLWIGGGEFEARVHEMSRDMNLAGGKLEVTGWMDHARALERLRHADIFVHFSRWDGLPNSVLEGMAAGLPIIASDIPGNRDLIRPGENGYLVKTEIELLERTLELIDNPQLRERMGAKGRKMVLAEFSPERALREFSDLYSTPLPE